MKPVILIPAYNPDEKCIDAIKALREAGYDRFVVVNDGSRKECAPIFEWLGQQEDILLLHHSVNCGKGRAMKTGFNEILNRGMAEDGVIVCDADGQHPVRAVNDVAAQMPLHPDSLVLGVRKFFEAANVPLPNLLGNTITRGAFWMITQVRYGDTQCGLRGFTKPVLEKMMTVVGERFEYENTMLLAVRSLRIPIVQVPMEAVYLDDNKSSHFNRTRDSIRIYKVILGFAKIPMIAAALNFIFFYFLRTFFGFDGGETLAFALGMAVGNLTMAFSVPGNRKISAVFVGAAITALCVWLETLFAPAIPAMGTWWILALPFGIACYFLWVFARCGKPAANIRYDKDEMK